MSFTLLGGKLTLKTPRNYPRPPEEALWLAASHTPAEGAKVLDAACGIGTVGLALLTRCPGLQVTGVEINPTVATTARQNASLNKQNITVICDNILNYKLNSTHPLIQSSTHLFDAIFCNPPFHESARGHTTPSPTQTERHSMPENLLQSWLTHFASLISPTGTIALILHTHQQTELAGLCQHLALSGNLYLLKTAAARKPKRLLALLTPSSNNLTLCDTLPIHQAALRQTVLEEAQPLF